MSFERSKGGVVAASITVWILQVVLPVLSILIVFVATLPKDPPVESTPSFVLGTYRLDAEDGSGYYGYLKLKDYDPAEAGESFRDYGRAEDSQDGGFINVEMALYDEEYVLEDILLRRAGYHYEAVGTEFLRITYDFYVRIGSTWGKSVFLILEGSVENPDFRVKLSGTPFLQEIVADPVYVGGQGLDFDEIN